MSRPIKQFAGLGLVIMLIFGVVIFFSAREPSHGGHTLSYWLQQYGGPTSTTEKIEEARDAVRAIGASQALPILLKKIQAKDTKGSLWWNAQCKRFHINFGIRPSALQSQLQGIDGFEVLGTNAAPAVEKLTRMLDNEVAFMAARCLEQIGPAAETALCQCLTNSDWQVRRLSVSALAAVTDDVEVYFNRLKGRLQDAETAVRFATVLAINGQVDAPDLAVPLLIDSLQDAEDSVSGQAANGLFDFGTNAGSAFPTLTNLVNTGRPRQIRGALKALSAVAPILAVPVLSNAVVNGSAETMAAALRSLKTIAPDLALEMMLAELCSRDKSRRLQALNVAAQYDTKAPGLVEALRSMAKDKDPIITEKVRSLMWRLLEKQEELSGSILCLANEPVFEGKHLGQWLKLRTEWTLSPAAMDAMRQMGTNVYPALLQRLIYREPVFNFYNYNVSMEAVGAFVCLGQDTKPMLPTLTVLMDVDDEGLAARALLATLGTGVDAVPSLMKGLTNRFANVRNEAAHTLISEWSDAFPEKRREALPFLRRLLNDPDEFVRMHATNQLQQVMAEAAVSVRTK